MKPLTRAIFGCVVAYVLFAFVLWLGGYNFDHRSPDLACAFVTFSVIAGTFSAFLYNKNIFD
jgi:hypothetical protein